MFDWFVEFITGMFYWGQDAYEWLITPFVNLNGFSLSPLLLISFSGLTTYLFVAVIKWFL